jgi:NADH dehydrogenase/NADH:ubiquinone oxidoreductase subunit G
MPETVTLTIDEQTVSVEQGATLLDAARSIGKDIPAICYHQATTSNALCRICVVEVRVNGSQPACIEYARE